FGDILRRTFGPNGLDKMMYKTNGENAITNDGAKIVADLLVKHPAAKAFVQLAESQENACGDGVTGCLLFASELMKEAGGRCEWRYVAIRRKNSHGWEIS
ncbi:MAG: TCP-1/cpn60 chaperonin family protein, partial [Candidatus Poseidoniaceae archaeon]